MLVCNGVAEGVGDGVAVIGVCPGTVETLDCAGVGVGVASTLVGVGVGVLGGASEIR